MTESNDNPRYLFILRLVACYFGAVFGTPVVFMVAGVTLEAVGMPIFVGVPLAAVIAVSFFAFCIWVVTCSERVSSSET